MRASHLIVAAGLLSVLGTVAVAKDTVHPRTKKEMRLSPAERTTRQRLDRKAAAPADKSFDSICIGCGAR